MALANITNNVLTDSGTTVESLVLASRTLTINGVTYDLTANRDWTLSTSNVGEGTNLYYTTARANTDFDTRLATKSTSNLSEGTNLYYTDARVGTYLTNNSYATQTYVNTAVSNLVDAAPGTLNTLNELAAALGDDPNFATTVAASIGTKEPIITAGTTSQYWRGDKTWQTLPIYTLSGLGGQPQLNGTGFVKVSGTTVSYDNSTYLTTSSASSTYQTILTNPITGTGTAGQVAFFNGTSSIASEINLLWDSSNNRLGIGVTPTQALDVVGKIKATDDLVLAQQNPAISFDNGASGTLRIFSSFSAAAIATFNSTGGFRLNQYGTGARTGTRTYDLAVDSLGNVIEVAVGAGTITGGGTAGQVPYFSGTSSIGSDANFTYNNSTNVFSVNGWVDSYRRFRLYFNDIQTLAAELYEDGASTNGGTLNLFGKASGTVDTVISAAPTKYNYINNNANFGIGYSSDQSFKLAVNGSVLTNGALQVGSSGTTSINFYLTRTNGGVPADANYFVATANTPNHSWIEGGYFTGELAGVITAPNSGYPYYEVWAGQGSVTNKIFGFVNKTSGTFTSSDLSPVLILSRTRTATFTSHVNSGGWFAAPNDYGLTALNAAGTAGRVLIKLNSSNQIEIGRDSDISRIILGTASTLSAAIINSNGSLELASRISTGGVGDQTYASLFIGGAVTSGTNQYAIILDPQLAGSGDNYGLFANARIRANTAVNNAFGVYIPSAERLSGATIVNNYALYIANQTSGSSTNYSIYSSGGLNYFGGNVGIGTASTLGGKLMIEATGNHLFLRAPGATAGKYWALDVSSANQFYIVNNAGSQYLTILDGGNTGLGVPAPSQKLDVSGRIRAFTASSGVSPRTDLGGTIIAEGTTRAGLYILTQGTSADNFGSIWFGNGHINTDAFITVNNGTRAMAFGTADGTRLTISSTGAATFSSSLTIGNTFNINTEAWIQFLGNNVLLADGSFTILQASGTGLIRFRNNSAQNLLTLANNGAATFSSSVSLAGGSEGLRLGNVGDNSAYDNVKFWYTGYNGGGPIVYLTPRTTPGSGVLNTFLYLQNSNGTSTSSNNTMGLLVDGSVGIGTTNLPFKLNIESTSEAAARIKSTNASGAARLILNPEGAGAGSTGDASIFFDCNSTAWVTGVDKSDGSRFKIAVDPYGDFRAGVHLSIDNVTDRSNVVIGGTTALSTAANRGNLTINGANNSILAYGTGGTLRGYLYCNGTSFFMNSGAGDFTIENNNATALIVNQNGYVGVRTQPLYQFSVNGGSNGIDLETSNNSTFATSIYYTIRESGVSRTITTGGYSYGSSNPLTMILTQNSNTPLGMFYAADNADGAGLKGYKSRGTVAAPITVNNGDTIFSIEGWAFHGSGPNHSKFGAGMRFVKDDAYGTANTFAPQRTEFYNANSTTTTQITFVINANGNVVATGDVTAYSDARVKTNINTIENALEKTMALRGVSYFRTDTDKEKRKIGVIAQEVRDILPELVLEDHKGNLSVSYGNMVGVLIEAIKEQQTQIVSQKSEIEELKDLVKQLINR